MTVLPHPDVIITHESDLDGPVAGVLLRRLAKTVSFRTGPLSTFFCEIKFV